VAVLQDEEALERSAFELAEDCQAEGVRYLEVRFAPQLHVRPGVDVSAVVRPSTGASGAPRRPSTAGPGSPGQGAPLRLRDHPLRDALLHAGVFPRLPSLLRGAAEAPEAEIQAAASLEVARAAARLRREEGLLVVGNRPRRPGEGYRRRPTARPTRWPTRPSSARRSTPARTTGRSRSSRRSGTSTPTASATAPGSSTRRRSRARASATASATSRTLRVHRRQADHDRGLPDLEPADRARAGRRPAEAPLRRDAEEEALHDVLHGQPTRVHTTVSDEIARAVEAFDLTPAR